ncbi:MAG: hypothetical protein KatS3mg002_1165 [Candidatus Woesearchaeota archaeon]|nr:MAG: hypothetical protein KatS3mg002_1165 [Candidatus Woesearchaeota archaeon]
MKKNRSKKWGIIFITLLISLSMILSIFAIVIDNQSTQQKYNGYKYIITNEGYKFKINKTIYTFQFHPTQLENINMSQDSKNILSNSMAIVMLFNPNSTLDDLTYIDYARFDFQEKSGKTVYFAITTESDKYLLPVLSCDNATAEVPFIFFNISTDTSIVNEGNCIILNAKLREILSVEERLTYQILGIMK